MTNRRFGAIALLVLGAGLTGACTKSVELKMAINVVSEPEQADIQFKGKSIGKTPANVDVKTFDDLESIVARKESLDVVEKRIRIISPDKATVIFKLGSKGGVNPVAKNLGLNNVLIFDYSEKVSFDSDKADLKEDALPILNKQADILNQYFPTATVHVCGYTDGTGADDHNMRLSVKRADAVTNYLIARGVSKDRIKPHGFGKEFPVDNNATSQGRALNRRTEVILPQ